MLLVVLCYFHRQHNMNPHLRFQHSYGCTWTRSFSDKPPSDDKARPPPRGRGQGAANTFIQKVKQRVFEDRVMLSQPTSNILFTEHLIHYRFNSHECRLSCRTVVHSLRSGYNCFSALLQRQTTHHFDCIFSSQPKKTPSKIGRAHV